MGIAAYRTVLASRDVRRVLALSFVIRIPLWAGNVLLTLHVVTHLHRSYGAAGLVGAAATVALAISAPWRGRRLDRVGLRAAVAPSLVVLAACWSVAPFGGYWLLLGLAFVAGLFVVPSFSIVRQALIHSVDESERKTALAVDSVAVEISFMIGPALGVLLATYAPTSWALFGCQFCSIAGGLVIWLVNPPLRADAPAADSRFGLRSWLSPNVIAILVMSAAATVVLTGTDVGVVAALRHMHHQSWIGWELALWGLGSALGGFVYGALHRTVSVPALLGLLAATTLPVIFARDALTMGALLFVAGLFCAPTVTAAVDALSRVVPAAVRGEALGWHGSAMTAGSAAGAPLAGVAIDRSGWHGGFILPAVVGLVAAAAGLVAAGRRHRAAALAYRPG
ncbi:MAG TPA: MFS transporter, partial [Jatrophihabitans sp.]|nr:MFS transporter [Jatrophihabitans sp.]